MKWKGGPLAYTIMPLLVCCARTLANGGRASEAGLVPQVNRSDPANRAWLGIGEHVWGAGVDHDSIRGILGREPGADLISVSIPGSMMSLEFARS